jgi:predicted nucleotidyltransferase
MDRPQIFDQVALEFALSELGRRSYEAGRTVEIAIYGGSALLLTMDRRVSTRDVDGVFEQDKDFVKKLAAGMAEEFGWDENWLNDGVKGWLSTVDANPGVKVLFKTYPSEEQAGLRVFVPKPEYLFAMKCRAMRIGGIDSSSDIEDIKLLAHKIGLTSSEDALALVESFYARGMLEPKTRFGLEEIFSSLGYDQTDADDPTRKP